MYPVGMTPPAKKKPGPPARFPERVIVYVTTETKTRLDETAERLQLSVPDVVRAFVRDGLHAIYGEADR